MEVVSIRVVARKSTSKKGNGDCTLNVLTTVKRNDKWVPQWKSLGISVRPEFWDFKNQQPAANHPEKKRLEKLIADTIAQKRVGLSNPFLEPYPIVEPEPETDKDLFERWRSSRVSFLVPPKSECPSESIQCPPPIPEPVVVPVPIQCPPKPVVDPDPVDLGKTSVFSLYQDMIAEMKNDDRIGSIRQFTYTLGDVRKFTNHKDLSFQEMDVHWLNRYKKWLNNKDLKDTTKHHLFTNLRVLFNRAIDLGYVSRDAYPFKKFKIGQFNTSTEKRAIEQEDIQKIMAVELDPKDTQAVFTQDLFAFSYLCGGVNFVDMAYLTMKNILDGKIKTISFKRKKTGAPITNPILPDANQILDRYNQGKGYIFPIFDAERHKTPQQQENRHRKMLKMFNTNLKKIGKLAGIDKSINLTSYVARHSFATVLMKEGASLPMISKAIGRTNMITTQKYLGDFNQKEQLKAFQCL